MKKFHFAVSILFSALFLTSCGTGPWFIPKNIYKTYKENIYSYPTDSIKSNGYYIQIGELHPNVDFRKALIFFNNGYTANFTLEESELNKEIKSKITSTNDSIFVALDWWKINNDSLVIEHFADPNFEMFTYNYFQKGRIINDSLIELKYEDSKYSPIIYQFIKTDSIPKIKNIGRYLKKKWYAENKNLSRK